MTPQDRARARMILETEKSAQILRVALMDLHTPKTTGAGIRCGQCAVWRGGKLVRAPWPCRTAQVLGIQQ